MLFAHFLTTSVDEVGGDSQQSSREELFFFFFFFLDTQTSVVANLAEQHSALTIQPKCWQLSVNNENPQNWSQRKQRSCLHILPVPSQTQSHVQASYIGQCKTHTLTHARTHIHTHPGLCALFVLREVQKSKLTSTFALVGFKLCSSVEEKSLWGSFFLF